MWEGHRLWLLRGAVVGLAFVVGVIAWRATHDDDATMPAAPQHQVVSEAEFLDDVAINSGQLVYWAGPIPGATLEVTKARHSVSVRYIPETEANDVNGRTLLSVSTYQLADPAAGIKAYAKQKGSFLLHSEDGRRVVVNKQHPTNVYFASPDNSVQVETYDPSPKRAMSLALSGRVRPAGQPKAEQRR